MKICNKCGNHCKDEALFCLTCGSSLSAQPVPIESQPTRQTKRCKKCGSTCEKDDAYCTVCGSNELAFEAPPAPKPFTVRACAQCHRAADREGAFCRYCGGNEWIEVEGAQLASAAPAALPRPPAPTASKKNGMALAGFIVAVTSVFVVFTGIMMIAQLVVGLVLSVLGYRKATQGAAFKGFALAGILISAIALGFFTMVIFSSALTPSV